MAKFIGYSKKILNSLKIIPRRLSDFIKSKDFIETIEQSKSKYATIDKTNNAILYEFSSLAYDTTDYTILKTNTIEKETTYQKHNVYFYTNDLDAVRDKKILDIAFQAIISNWAGLFSGITAHLLCSSEITTNIMYELIRYLTTSEVSLCFKTEEIYVSQYDYNEIMLESPLTPSAILYHLYKNWGPANFTGSLNTTLKARTGITDVCCQATTMSDISSVTKEISANIINGREINANTGSTISSDQFIHPRTNQNICELMADIITYVTDPRHIVAP